MGYWHNPDAAKIAPVAAHGLNGQIRALVDDDQYFIRLQTAPAEANNDVGALDDSQEPPLAQMLGESGGGSLGGCIHLLLLQRRRPPGAG
jgi:hypothetical protein